MKLESYIEGYEAAYAEIYEAMGSSKHRLGECNDCRACGLIKEMVSYAVETVSAHMTQEEHNTVFEIFVNAYERLREEMDQY